MSRKIHFELISPEKKLVSQDIRMAVIPGDEGAFGVMGGHCSLLASLDNGVLKLYKESEKEAPQHIFIAGGFADVTAEKCCVLAEEAIPVLELDKAELEQKLKDLNEDLTLTEDEIDLERIKKHIVIVKAKLSALQVAA